MEKNKQFKDKFPLLYKHRKYIIYLIVSFFLLGFVFSCQSALIKQSFENIN